MLAIDLDNRVCILCKSNSNISSAIKICVNCLRSTKLTTIKPHLKEIHSSSRKSFNLPLQIPQFKTGIACTTCGAKCKLGVNETSWCGLKKNKEGQFQSLFSSNVGLMSYYLDPQITNCCNIEFCPAGSGCGYPEYAYHNKNEVGYFNLALFLYGCSFNCLFCQNWQHKIIDWSKKVSKEELINITIKNNKISCWCWFGGSIEPQLPFVISTSREMLKRKINNKILRICVEWNGDGHPKLVEKLAEIIYKSGGNIKFDFKAMNQNLHQALTGRKNSNVLNNIKLIYDKFEKENDRHVPMLGISTLLVPYYLDKTEIENISKFVARLDPEIPYSLLVFHPDYYMKDLPITPIRQVKEAYAIAKKSLNNVRIGNLHLLGFRSMEELMNASLLD
ncbi:MAG: radical SAM protein [Candidatus Hodarchaeales archaeon]